MLLYINDHMYLMHTHKILETMNIMRAKLADNEQLPSHGAWKHMQPLSLKSYTAFKNKLHVSYAPSL